MQPAREKLPPHFIGWAGVEVQNSKVLGIFTWLLKGQTSNTVSQQHYVWVPCVWLHPPERTLGFSSCQWCQGRISVQQNTHTYVHFTHLIILHVTIPMGMHLALAGYSYPHTQRIHVHAHTCIPQTLVWLARPWDGPASQTTQTHARMLNY